MDTEATLLQAIHGDPGDDIARRALADWLEEQDRIREGELLRLHVDLRHGLPKEEFVQAHQRLCTLIAEGVRPVMSAIHNSVGMSFMLIPPGAFWMGSPASESDRFADEGPEHEVTISRPFYLAAFPVTQGEYLGVIGGDNPSYFSTAGEGRNQLEDRDTRRHPVEGLSWDDATEFCQALGRLPAEEAQGRVYRLPTEAEWEYVCRAGISRAGPFHFGVSLSSTQANFDGRYPFGGGLPGPYLRRTTPVDAYPPNAWGVYDLHGNISEWCSDWFDDNYYLFGPTLDPQGPPTGHHRVLRGGSWSDDGKYCRAAFRYDRLAEEGRHDFGMRIVLEYHP